MAKLKPIWGDRKELFLPLVIVLGVGGFYLLTIRDGHDWGGDFSMFLQHAENISSGRPYAETPFVPHEASEIVGPPAYPPVFPLFLAALSLVGKGPGLTIMKAGVVVFFMLFLVAVGSVLRRRLPTEKVALILLVLGLSPYFWDFKDQVLSDIPFAFFVWLTLWLAEVEEADESSRARTVGLTLAVGVVTYIATATRNLGITLIPTLVVYEVLMHRRFPLHSAAASLVAVVLLAIQRSISGVNEGYLTVFRFDPARVVGNFFEYTFSLKGLFWNGYLNGVAVAVWLLVTLLAIYGYRQQLRERPSILEVFTAVYVAPVVLWPFYQGIRLLVPIIPLYLYYALIGFTALRGRMAPAVTARITAVMAVLVFASYAAAYTRVDYGEVSSGISEPEAVKLFDYVRTSQHPADLYVFFKPRVLAYYTGARTAVNYQPSDRHEVWRFYDAVGASHVIVRKGDGFLEELVRTDPKRLAEVYRNAEFAVYALVDSAAPDQEDGQ